VPIGERITSIVGGAKKSVINILTVGINKGYSAKQIAGDIANYIVKDNRKSWVSPYQWYREKFGFKRRIPNGIPPGSLQYNAVRIARTEINNTYRQATIDIHKNKPWVKGYEWVLSPSHPVEDICDAWADGGPYTYAEAHKLGHVHCMCHIEVVYKSKEEMEL
jgi:hypothetical protein